MKDETAVSRARPRSDQKQHSHPLCAAAALTAAAPTVKVAAECDDGMLAPRSHCRRILLLPALRGSSACTWLSSRVCGYLVGTYKAL